MLLVKWTTPIPGCGVNSAGEFGGGLCVDMVKIHSMLKWNFQRMNKNKETSWISQGKAQSGSKPLFHTASNSLKKRTAQPHFRKPCLWPLKEVTKLQHSNVDTEPSFHIKDSAALLWIKGVIIVNEDEKWLLCLQINICIWQLTSINYPHQCCKVVDIESSSIIPCCFQREHMILID